MRKYIIALDVLTSFWVFSAVTLAWHEACHAWVTRLLGGQASVVYYFLSGYTVISNISGWALVIVALSGGIGCFLLFLYFFLWWLEDPSDRYVRLPCLYFLANQLCYGLFEAGIFLGLPVSFEFASLISTGIALIPTVAWVILRG